MRLEKNETQGESTTQAFALTPRVADHSLDDLVVNTVLTRQFLLVIFPVITWFDPACLLCDKFQGHPRLVSSKRRVFPQCLPQRKVDSTERLLFNHDSHFIFKS